MEKFPPQPLIECFINNVKVTALIDTGSMLSILSQSIFDKLPDKPLLHSSDSNACISITGQSLQSWGKFLARLQFPGSTHSYNTPFLICDNVLAPLECILGWDFLLSHQFNLVLHDSRYFLEGPHGKSSILPGAEGPIPPSTADTLVFEQSLHRGPVPLTLVSSIILPARSEVVLIAHVPRSLRNALGMVAPFVSDDFPSGLYPAYSVSTADNRFVLVRLINTNNEVCELHKGQRVADFCPINSVISPDLPAPHRQALVGGTLNVSNEVANELSSALSSTLSSCERNTLLATLLRYADVFEHSLGHITVVRHNIDTGDFPLYANALVVSLMHIAKKLTIKFGIC